MIGINDWSNEPMANIEAIAANDAAIDAEIASWKRPTVVDLDGPLHQYGVPCGDPTCYCAQSGAWTE